MCLICSLPFLRWVHVSVQNGAEQFIVLVAFCYCASAADVPKIFEWETLSRHPGFLILWCLSKIKRRLSRGLLQHRSWHASAWSSDPCLGFLVKLSFCLPLKVLVALFNVTFFCHLVRKLCSLNQASHKGNMRTCSTYREKLPLIYRSYIEQLIFPVLVLMLLACTWTSISLFDRWTWMYSIFYTSRYYNAFVNK